MVHTLNLQVLERKRIEGEKPHQPEFCYAALEPQVLICNMRTMTQNMYVHHALVSEKSLRPSLCKVSVTKVDSSGDEALDFRTISHNDPEVSSLA